MRRLHPDALHRLERLAADIVAQIYRPDLDRPLALPVAADDRRSAAEEQRLQIGLARQRLRHRHVGHGDLVIEPALLDLERYRHREDRLAVLDGDDAAGVEALAVA